MSDTTATMPEGIAREPERAAFTGVPCSTWRRYQDEGLAPLPIQLGPHAVGWLRSELRAWLEARKAQRNAVNDTWQQLGEPVGRVVTKLATKL